MMNEEIQGNKSRYELNVKQSSEPKFRINIKQNAKLEDYWDITVRGNDLESLTKDLDELKRLAIIRCGQVIVKEE